MFNLHKFAARPKPKWLVQYDEEGNVVERKEVGRGRYPIGWTPVDQYDQLIPAKPRKEDIRPQPGAPMPGAPSVAPQGQSYVSMPHEQVAIDPQQFAPTDQINKDIVAFVKTNIANVFKYKRDPSPLPGEWNYPEAKSYVATTAWTILAKEIGEFIDIELAQSFITSILGGDASFSEMPAGYENYFKPKEEEGDSWEEELGGNMHAQMFESMLQDNPQYILYQLMEQHPVMHGLFSVIENNLSDRLKYSFFREYPQEDADAYLQQAGIDATSMGAREFSNFITDIKQGEPSYYMREGLDGILTEKIMEGFDLARDISEFSNVGSFLERDNPILTDMEKFLVQKSMYYGSEKGEMGGESQMPVDPETGGSLPLGAETQVKAPIRDDAFEDREEELAERRLFADIMLVNEPTIKSTQSFAGGIANRMREVAEKKGGPRFISRMGAADVMEIMAGLLVDNFNSLVQPENQHRAKDILNTDEAEFVSGSLKLKFVPGRRDDQGNVLYREMPDLWKLTSYQQVSDEIERIVAEKENILPLIQNAQAGDDAEIARMLNMSMPGKNYSPEFIKSTRLQGQDGINWLKNQTTENLLNKGRKPSQHGPKAQLMGKVTTFLPELASFIDKNGEKYDENVVKMFFSMTALHQRKGIVQPLHLNDDGNLIWENKQSGGKDVVKDEVPVKIPRLSGHLSDWNKFPYYYGAMREPITPEFYKVLERSGLLQTLPTIKPTRDEEPMIDAQGNRFLAQKLSPIAQFNTDGTISPRKKRRKGASQSIVNIMHYAMQKLNTIKVLKRAMFKTSSFDNNNIHVIESLKRRLLSKINTKIKKICYSPELFPDL